MSANEAHLSPYQLDSLRLGRLTADGVRAARSHLGDCAACRHLEESLVTDQRRFVEEVLPAGRTLLQSRAERVVRAAAWRRWLLVTLAPLAPAALVLVLVARPRAGVAPAVYQGEKGGPSFQVVGQRGGRVFPVSDQGPLRAGDSVRFVVSSHYPYLMIASVDGRGRAQVYAPYDGSESTSVLPDQRVELPEGSSIELDATPGPERLFALYSKKPLSARAVRGALERLGARGADAVRATEHLDFPADAQLSELVEKVDR